MWKSPYIYPFYPDNGFLPESDYEDHLDFGDGDDPESLVRDTDSEPNDLSVKKKHVSPPEHMAPSRGEDEGMDSDGTEDLNEPETRVCVLIYSKSPLFITKLKGQ